MDHIAEPGKSLEALQAENAKLRALLDKVGMERAAFQGELMAANLQKHELQEILARMLDAGEVDLHGEDPKCPGDDTCACPWAKKIGAAMMDYTEKRNHPCPKCGHEPETHGQLCRCTDPVCLEIDAEQRRASKGLGR